MLAPDVTTAETQIVDTFNSNASITAATHALENTALEQLTPTPDWWTTINQELTASQASSMSWLTSTSPTLFATATQSYIDYANYFNTAVGTLQQYVDQIQSGGNITTPSSSQVQGLVAIFGHLLTIAQTNLTNCADLQAQVDSFRTEMATSQDEINTAISDALETEEDLSAEIQAMQTQIESLMSQLAVYTSKADAADISSEKTVSTLAVKMVFAFAMTGGAASIGTLAAAVVSIGVDLTEEIIYSDKIAALVSQISSDLETLGEEEVQLVFTQAVVTSLQTVLDANTSALETFTDLTTIWSEVVDDLQWLLVVLSQPQIDVSKVPALLDLPDANSAWQSIAAFATTTQSTSFTNSSISLPQTTVQSTEAA